LPHRQTAGDQNDARDANAAFFQRLRRSGGAPRAVALAGDEERCVQEIESRPKRPDELGGGCDVAECVVELGRVLRLRRSREPRADRIDEDEIGERQPRRVVVVQLERHRRGMRRVVWRAQPSRTEADEVHGRRVRPGTSIPYEDQGPLRLTRRPIHRVRHESEMTVHLTGVVVADRQEADARGITQHRSVDTNLMTRGRQIRLLKCRSLLRTRSRDK